MRVRIPRVQFLSHSWHDPPGSKWAALQAWAADFQARHGREAVVWFDRCCLNQEDIQSQLAFLPIFLAGSRVMLCLIGPTYTERIWCIVELYTFLKMGGSTDEKLQVVPIAPDGADGEEGDEAALEATIARCRHFDVTSTKCFDEAQRQALLSVIELGFGSLDTFDSLIRSIVPGKLERHLIDGAGATRTAARGTGTSTTKAAANVGGGGGKGGGVGASFKSPPRVAPSSSHYTSVVPGGRGRGGTFSARNDSGDHDRLRAPSSGLEVEELEP